MERYFRILARVTLVCVFLIVLAGSVVRMTGSGMGCPDWPKCFGYIIPPTEDEQVQWEPNRVYLEGQMIVRNDALWIAQGNFTTANEYKAENWERYDRHDYAIFNVMNTWTEDINRLIGAFSGIPMLLLTLLAFSYWKKDKLIPLLSLFTLFMFGFEAWLGKVVVDGNLIPMQITLHMFGALIIIALLIFLIARSADKPKLEVDFKIKPLLGIVMALSALQIFLGTNVREEVDSLLRSGVLRNDVVEVLPVIFKIHRSYSILLVLMHLSLFVWWRKSGLDLKRLLPVFVIITLEIVLGITLTYAGFPKLAQPAHLILGMMLFAYQLHLYLRITSMKKIQSGEASLA